jgi:hypothetical protein
MFHRDYALGDIDARQAIGLAALLKKNPSVSVEQFNRYRPCFGSAVPANCCQT